MDKDNKSGEHSLLFRSYDIDESTKAAIIKQARGGLLGEALEFGDLFSMNVAFTSNTEDHLKGGSFLAVAQVEEHQYAIYAIHMGLYHPVIVNTAYQFYGNLYRTIVKEGHMTVEEMLTHDCKEVREVVRVRTLALLS